MKNRFTVKIGKILYIVDAASADNAKLTFEQLIEKLIKEEAMKLKPEDDENQRAAG